MRRRPSPALVVSVIALIAAGAGSATAATLITSKDVKDRSLRGKDLRSNTVTGRNVKGLSGRDVIRNGLDGSDIDEQTLEEVPNAARARRATTATTAEKAATADSIAGASVKRLHFATAVRPDAVTLYDQGGLLVQARCSAPGTLIARAAPTADGGVLRVSVLHPGSPTDVSYVTDNDLRKPDSVNLVQGGAANAQGRLTYHAPTGDVTTIEYLAQDAVDAGRGFQCLFAGTAVHTAP